MKKRKVLIFTAVMAMSLCIPGKGVLAESPPGSESTKTVSYDDVYKIPSEAITSITNNAGNYGSSVIKNAIDGKTTTHWETNKPNSGNFMNKVTITFDESYEVARLAYMVRQDGAKPKGFPLSYRLYYSEKSSGDDFQLLKDGSFGSASGDKVEMNFEPTEMKRVQLEWVQAYNSWVSAAEISFYKYDSLAVKMEDLFTDKTFSELKAEYQNEEVLNKLVEEAKEHPKRDEYLSLLKDAKALIANPEIYNGTTFTASQRGNVSSEASRTQTGNMLALDSTGYYVTPGEKITVYVEADPKGIMPKLAFGQVAKDKNDWRRFYTLQPGMNVITAQQQSQMNPAAIYISNEALPNQQAYAPKIRLVGGTKFPLYVHGKTSTDEFYKELDSFMKNVSYNDEDFANGNPNGYNYNIAEIASDNTTITTSAAGAYKEVKNIIASGSSVEAKMDGWEDMYMSYATYSGFDIVDESSANFRPRGKFMSRVFCQGPYAWADNGYTGYNGGNDAKRENGFFSAMISSASNGGWGVYHEWGHVYENKVIQRGEATNNLFSLMMQDKYIENNRMVQENRWEQHFTNYHNTKKYPKDDLFYGAMAYQLETVYGQDLYGRAALISRTNPDGVLKGLTTNHDKLVVCLSLAAGENLSGHYEYYGEKVSDTAKNKIAHLPVPDKKTYYVNNKSFEASASAFVNPESKPIVKTTVKNGINIKISIDEQDQSVLCHEIYRDGEFIGVTYGDTFVDKNAAENTTYTYTAITYDRKLNTSLTSDEVQQNTSEPIINIVGETVIVKGTEFDPLSVVGAVDVAGDDITSLVSVESGEVDTSLSGVYPITFAVTDSKGNPTKKTVDIIVKDTLDYVSDLEAKSATVGWGKLFLDKAPSGKAITVLLNGQDKSFTKGLGAHANSDIIYDITDKGYTVFESMIGIDQAMKGISNSSVTFQVWLDGSLAFESPVMYSDTAAQQILLDVSGVKEVRLVAKAGANNYSDHAVWAGAKFAGVVPLKKDELESAITFAQKMTEAEKYQKPSLNHKEDRWFSLQAVLAEATACIENPDTAQEDIDLYTRLVVYYIEENGQSYVAGQEPQFYGEEVVDETLSESDTAESDAVESDTVESTDTEAETVID